MLKLQVDASLQLIPFDDPATLFATKTRTASYLRRGPIYDIALKQASNRILLPFGEELARVKAHSRYAEAFECRYICIYS
jgi:hypothetical protein